MSSRSYERRTERATAEEVAEVERQLWEFAKRIDPPSVPEAKLRPGAFLWRIHRTWHDLGRGTGGLASRSFRALRDELLERDPPVRNLQPKLYGNTPLSQAEAEQLIDVMLETWHLERNRGGKWQARPIFRSDIAESAGNQDLEAIRENILHTLFKGDDHLLLEEPIGVLPEFFFGERGHTSLALILPTKSETLAQFSPSIAYSGFSGGLTPFFEAAAARQKKKKPAPLLIWALRLRAVRDNVEFHQAFHAIALHASCLTNWYLRLSHKRGVDQEQMQTLWDLVLRQSAFVIHGLPDWSVPKHAVEKLCANTKIDEDLADLEPNYFVPNTLPIVFGSHRQIKNNRSHNFSFTVGIEPDGDIENNEHNNIDYWLWPDQPKTDFEETAETIGLPFFNADMSPGADFDRAYRAIYDAVRYRFGFSNGHTPRSSFATLLSMGWRILTVEELQHTLLVQKNLKSGKN